MTLRGRRIENFLKHDQYWSLFVEWIIKNPLFPWYLIPFLSEAVEASLCYFFEIWWMKLKCPLVMKPLVTKVQENSQSFYPSEPLRIIHFTMGHLVFGWYYMWSVWSWEGISSNCQETFWGRSTLFSRTFWTLLEDRPSPANTKGQEISEGFFPCL